MKAERPEPDSPFENCLDPFEAAELTGIGIERIRRWCKRGTVVCWKVGGRFWIDRASLQDCVRASAGDRLEGTVTAAEAAKMAGVCAGTVMRWCKDGLFSSEKRRGAWLINEPAFRKWLKDSEHLRTRPSGNYLSVSEAASIANVRQTQVWSWIRSQRFTVLSVGPRWWVERDSFEAWLKQRDQAPGACHPWRGRLSL